MGARVRARNGVLPDCPPDEALEVIGRLRAATPPVVGCSVGIACSDGSESPATIVRRADAALYDVKFNGGGARLAC